MGSHACEPTPAIWALCSKDDVKRSPAVCSKDGIDRDPAPANRYNPGQDVSLGHTLCTSCFPGDALEMVHPETQTGICRAFGPKDGSANLNSMPSCHTLNNMVATSANPNQVCTKIFRPAILYRGNQTDSFLAGHNMFAYVTCNVRKMTVCRPGAFSNPMVPAKPASYANSRSFAQKLRCDTEKQVSCANVCRVNMDGQLCLKGNSTGCVSKTTWTPPQARMMTRSKLLSVPTALARYDCDPTRCSAHYCHQVALD